MIDKQIIHGEQVPLITLTRQQLEEDWFTLWELYKAKEQECEELKKQIKIIDDETIVVEITEKQFEEYQKLKAENDELKFQNKRLDEVALYWHKRIFKVERNERKLKQTLTEIKEIGETCSFTDNSELLLSRIEHILEKISECEVE